jgi:zinc D-Ala-D-Ala carboxypeptidase
MKPLRPKSNPFQFIAITFLTAAVIIWLGLGLYFFLGRSQPSQTSLTTDQRDATGQAPAAMPPQEARNQPQEIKPSPIPLSSQSSLPTLSTPQPLPPLNSSAPILSAGGTDDQFEMPPLPNRVATSIQTACFGHFPYAEDAQNRLQTVGLYYDRKEYLDWEAASAFISMQGAAAVEGIKISPISGFRTIADQKKLFRRQIARQGGEQAAARLSAPPGCSEHHTGYAIDIGDQEQPDTDLKFEFENTAAYRWLNNHSKKYGFELSFPINNKQGVSFEPWHWRYVGSTRSAYIFAQAMQMK